MSILAANFKHLYQRRVAWFWCVLILCQMPAILMPPFFDKIRQVFGISDSQLADGNFGRRFAKRRFD